MSKNNLAKRKSLNGTNASPHKIQNNLKSPAKILKTTMIKLGLSPMKKFNKEQHILKLKTKQIKKKIPEVDDCDAEEVEDSDAEENENNNSSSEENSEEMNDNSDNSAEEMEVDNDTDSEEENEHEEQTNEEADNDDEEELEGSEHEEEDEGKEVKKEVVESSFKTDQKNQNSVVVKNLPLKTTENEIIILFEDCEVKYVYLKSDQTYKFNGVAIVYFNDPDSAKKSLSKHNTNFNGNIISVNPSVNYPYLLSLKNLDPKCTKHDIIKLFEDLLVGPIHFVRKGSYVTALVRFQQADCVKKAIKKHRSIFKDRVIDIHISFQTVETLGFQVIQVSNITNCTDEEIRVLFDDCKILQISMNEISEITTIVVEDEESKAKLLKKNGIEYKGNVIKISPRRPYITNKIESYSIFISNIGSENVEERVRSLLHDCKIDTIKPLTSKGNALVVLKDEESVNNALLKNTSEGGENLIKITLTTSSQACFRIKSRCLYVGNIDENSNHDDIRNIFNDCNILECWVKKEKDGTKYAVVYMVDDESIKRGLEKNESKINNKNLIVKIEHRMPAGYQPAETKSKSRLFNQRSTKWKPGFTRHSTYSKPGFTRHSTYSKPGFTRHTTYSKPFGIQKRTFKNPIHNSSIGKKQLLLDELKAQARKLERELQGQQ